MGSKGDQRLPVSDGETPTHAQIVSRVFSPDDTLLALPDNTLGAQEDSSQKQTTRRHTAGKCGNGNGRPRRQPADDARTLDDADGRDCGRPKNGNNPVHGAVFSLTFFFSGSLPFFLKVWSLFFSGVDSFLV